ncbi:hypothetical protein Tco_0139349 [Tanacetum coccineum]
MRCSNFQGIRHNKSSCDKEHVPKPPRQIKPPSRTRQAVFGIHASTRGGGRGSRGGRDEVSGRSGYRKGLMDEDKMRVSMEHDYIQELLDAEEEKRQQEEWEYQERLYEEAFYEAMEQQRMYEQMDEEREIQNKEEREYLTDPINVASSQDMYKGNDVQEGVSDVADAYSSVQVSSRKQFKFYVTPDGGDGAVQFMLYNLAKPCVPSCIKQFVHVEDVGYDLHSGFTLALLDSLFSKGLHIVKSIPLKCCLGCSRILKGALNKMICKLNDISCWVSLLVLLLCLLKTFRPRSYLECRSAIKRQRQEESIVNAIRSLGMPGGSLQILRESLAKSSSSFLDVDDEDIDLGKWNINQCKRKIFDGHYTMALRVLSCSGVAPYSDATLDDLKTKHPFKPTPSLPHIPFDHHHLIASPTVVLDIIKSIPHGTAPLTPLVKPGGGIHPIVMGNSSAMNCLIEGRGDDVGLSMLLVDFKNAFNLVDLEVMLREVRLCCPAISRWGWYLDDGTIVGDTLIVGKVLELIIEDGPRPQRSFEVALLSSLERIITTSGLGFGN